jgi:hypothetical protein
MRTAAIPDRLEGRCLRLTERLEGSELPTVNSGLTARN